MVIGAVAVGDSADVDPAIKGGIVGGHGDDGRAESGVGVATSTSTTAIAVVDGQDQVAVAQGLGAVVVGAAQVGPVDGLSRARRLFHP